jgi:hypothetical protein
MLTPSEAPNKKRDCDRAALLSLLPRDRDVGDSPQPLTGRTPPAESPGTAAMTARPTGPASAHPCSTATSGLDSREAIPYY